MEGWRRTEEGWRRTEEGWRRTGERWRRTEDVTNPTLSGRYSRPGRVWLVTSQLGKGKSLTIFYSVLNVDPLLNAAGLGVIHAILGVYIYW
jgi:hypothetical protein